MNVLRASSGLNGAHKTFVHSDNVFEDHPEPVSSRYEEAVMAVPELGSRKMFEDCTDIYQKVYESGSGERLTQCLNWVSLQRQFWLFLYGNNMCGTGALGIEMNNCTLWYDRLYLRHADVKPWRRGGKDEGKILRPKIKHVSKTEGLVVH